MPAEELLKKYTIISDQITKPKLAIILKYLGDILTTGVLGDVVEFGCYKGTTSLFLQRILKNTQKELFLYDSFEGLPIKTPQDESIAGEQFKQGELKSSKKNLINEFKKANLTVPNIKKSWFKNLKKNDIPKQICFGFLDGDYFDSIIDSLKLCWPNLNKDGVVIIDDYSNEALPGVEKACRFFFKDKNDYIFKNIAGLGVYIKI